MSGESESTYPDEFGRAMEKSGRHILVPPPEDEERETELPMDLATAEVYEMDWLYLWEFLAAHID